MQLKTLTHGEFVLRHGAKCGCLRTVLCGYLTTHRPPVAPAGRLARLSHQLDPVDSPSAVDRLKRNVITVIPDFNEELDWEKVPLPLAPPRCRVCIVLRTTPVGKRKPSGSQVRTAVSDYAHP
eukprot:1178476-Prorocentrum_minimum.AAC.3